MKKSEMEQIIADQADEIAALIERNDQLLTINEEIKSIALRALDLCDHLRVQVQQQQRTISDLLKAEDILDIHFPNTES